MCQDIEKGTSTAISGARDVQKEDCPFLIGVEKGAGAKKREEKLVWYSSTSNSG